jgi:hypothetical protein
LLPLLQARIASIWSILAEFVVEVAVPRVDYHAFKLKVVLADGSTLRISEQYYRDTLEQYAYYWLDVNNCLLIGWDNAPHHPHLPSFPHHKHVGSQDNRQPSEETTPEEILAAIRARLLDQ